VTSTASPLTIWAGSSSVVYVAPPNGTWPQPIRFRATATPMDTPIPLFPPMATAKEAETMTALITERLAASRSRLPALLTMLSSMAALVLVKMTLVASAPAPLTPTAVLPENAAAMDAAAETALIVSVPVAEREIPPMVLCTPWSALRIKACTLLLMVLVARETPMETDTPVSPAKEAAMEAAAASAEMVDVSSAARAMSVAEIPVAPSPSMDDSTSTPIQFSEKTPEPLTPTPTLPAAPMPTEAAMTAELMVWLASAVCVSWPSASILESTT